MKPNAKTMASRSSTFNCHRRFLLFLQESVSEKVTTYFWKLPRLFFSRIIAVMFCDALTKAVTTTTFFAFYLFIQFHYCYYHLYAVSSSILSIYIFMHPEM